MGYMATHPKPPATRRRHHLLKNKVDLDKHLLLFSIPELRAVDWAAMRERARVFGGHDTLPAMEAMTAYAQRVR
jgi:hypothetical protein